MITTTYENLKEVLKDCKSSITSCPSDPPDGYDQANEELTKIADACWYSGMDQMETAILNWAYDQPDAIKALRDDAMTCQAQFERVMAGDSFARLNAGDREILLKIHEWIQSLNVQNTKLTGR